MGREIAQSPGKMWVMSQLSEHYRMLLCLDNDSRVDSVDLGRADGRHSLGSQQPSFRQSEALRSW